MLERASRETGEAKGVILNTCFRRWLEVPGHRVPGKLEDKFLLLFDEKTMDEIYRIAERDGASHSDIITESFLFWCRGGLEDPEVLRGEAEGRRVVQSSGRQGNGSPRYRELQASRRFNRPSGKGRDSEGRGVAD